MGFTVKQLRSILEAMPDELLVVVRCTEQESGYSPLSCVEQGIYGARDDRQGGFVAASLVDLLTPLGWTPNAVALFARVDDPYDED